MENKLSQEERNIINKIIKENVIGVNQDKLKSHHDFIPSIINCILSYHSEKNKEIVKQIEERIEELVIDEIYIDAIFEETVSKQIEFLQSLLNIINQ